MFFLLLLLFVFLYSPFNIEDGRRFMFLYLPKHALPKSIHTSTQQIFMDYLSFLHMMTVFFGR